jgi:hypothetical protein
MNIFRKIPSSKTAYIASKKFKFQPEDSSSLFARFLRLQANPNSLIEEKIKVPPMYSLFQSLSSPGQ